MDGGRQPWGRPRVAGGERHVHATLEADTGQCRGNTVNARMRPLGGLGLLALAMPSFESPQFGRSRD